MNDIVKEVLPALQLFLPGFLAMTIFYWFADVPRANQFERVIQALICTTFITMMVGAIEQIAYLAGRAHSFGAWTGTTASIFAGLLAVLLGALLAHGSKHDWIYSLARKARLTDRSSTPEAIHIFRTYGTDGVVLHMLDERRLMGYLVTFPEHQTSGYYLIDEPHWLIPGAERPERISGIGCILINSADVRWVEFLKGGKP